jgi:hypothetical protein
MYTKHFPLYTQVSDDGPVGLNIYGIFYPRNNVTTTCYTWWFYYFIINMKYEGWIGSYTIKWEPFLPYINDGNISSHKILHLKKNSRWWTMSRTIIMLKIIIQLARYADIPYKVHLFYQNFWAYPTWILKLPALYITWDLRLLWQWWRQILSSGM